MGYPCTLDGMSTETAHFWVPEDNLANRLGTSGASRPGPCRPGGPLHTCRHRAGTDMYAVARDIRAVQEILGHASVRTTQLYVQVDDDALLAAVMGIVV